jgi:NAD dependent epimerase/dehydratase family enzyme
VSYCTPYNIIFILSFWDVCIVSRSSISRIVCLLDCFRSLISLISLTFLIYIYIYIYIIYIFGYLLRLLTQNAMQLPVGDGNQYFPFISSRDMSRAMIHILQTPSLDGVININAPIPATNYDFTIAMGNIMNRPVLIPFPKFAVSILFGEMGEEVLLGGTKATPKKLLDSGFKFLDPTVDDAVRSAVLSKK